MFLIIKRKEVKKIKEDSAIPGDEKGLVRRQTSQHTMGRRGGREETCEGRITNPAEMLQTARVGVG